MAEKLDIIIIDKAANELMIDLMDMYFKRQDSYDANIKGYVTQEEGLVALKEPETPETKTVTLCGVVGNGIAQFNGAAPWATYEPTEFIAKIKELRPSALVGIYSSIFSEKFAKEKGADFYLDKIKQYQKSGDTFVFHQMLKQMLDD